MTTGLFTDSGRLRRVFQGPILDGRACGQPSSPPGAANLGSLRSRHRTPLRYASLRAAPCAAVAQIRVPSHFILDLTSMISYPFPAPRHHSLV